MKSKNIKVVDEHNIDREASIIFGFDLDGSEYVTYRIERDEESNNVFVSKVIKNLDDTFNLANIEDEFEKENVAKIVKDLITKSVSDEADKFVGDSLTLENGKVVKFITVSFNKEQRFDVKKTYITTVKKEVTKVSEQYYDVVVSIEEPQLVEEVSLGSQETFPEITPVVEPKEEEVALDIPVVSEPIVNLETPDISLSSNINDKDIPKNLNDSFVPFGVEEVNEEMSNMIPVVEEDKFQSVASGSLSDSSVVEKEEEIPVLEAPKVEKHDLPQVSVQTVQEEPNVVLPEPIVSTPVTSVPVDVEPVLPEASFVSESVLVPEKTTTVEPQTVSVVETQPLVFNASKETNLNAALGEVADTTIPVENIDVVREFGEEAPATLANTSTSVQSSIAPMVQPELSSDPKTLTRKAGFANSKFFMVVAVAFFLASCVFLGYEVFNYFQLTK